MGLWCIFLPRSKLFVSRILKQAGCSLGRFVVTVLESATCNPGGRRVCVLKSKTIATTRRGARSYQRGLIQSPYDLHEFIA